MPIATCRLSMHSLISSRTYIFNKAFSKIEGYFSSVSPSDERDPYFNVITDVFKSSDEPYYLTIKRFFVNEKVSKKSLQGHSLLTLQSERSGLGDSSRMSACVVLVFRCGLGNILLSCTSFTSLAYGETSAKSPLSNGLPGILA